MNDYVICPRCLGLKMIEKAKGGETYKAGQDPNKIIHVICPTCHGAGVIKEECSGCCPHGYQDWSDCPDCGH
jgi:hypothetical protein